MSRQRVALPGGETKETSDNPGALSQHRLEVMCVFKLVREIPTAVALESFRRVALLSLANITRLHGELRFSSEDPRET